MSWIDFRLPLAACVCLLGTAASAQTLSIYGHLNTSIERTSSAGTHSLGLHSNYSTLGLQGQEDLGAGLTAGFVLESVLESDTGAVDGGFFSSQSEVNLSGPWGKLRLGHMSAPSYYAIADVVSTHNYDGGNSADALYASVANNSNRISYSTPEAGDLHVEVGTSLHEKTASPARNAWDVAVNYEHGPWTAGLGYSDWGPARQAALRLGYAVSEHWRVLGYHQYSRGWDHANEAVDASAPGRRTTRLAVVYSQGPHEWHTNLAYAGRAGGQAATQAYQWTVMYNHHLSRRTKVYAFATQVRNAAQARYFTGDAGVGIRSVGTGLRQFF